MLLWFVLVTIFSHVLVQCISVLLFEISAQLGWNDAGWNCGISGQGNIAHFADWVCRKDDWGQADWSATSTQNNSGTKCTTFLDLLQNLRPHGIVAVGSRAFLSINFIIDSGSEDFLNVTTASAHGKQLRMHWIEVFWRPVEPGYAGLLQRFVTPLKTWNLEQPKLYTVVH